MGLDFQPMKVVVPIGAAANTAATEYPLLAAGSNYIQVQAVRLLDRAGMSGASGSAYMQATAYNKGRLQPAPPSWPSAATTRQPRTTSPPTYHGR